MRELFGAARPQSKPDLTPALTVSSGAPGKRRYLVMSSKSAKVVSWAWVDDPGTCGTMHPHDDDGTAQWSKWHLYQTRPTGKKGAVLDDMPYRVLAFRCPSTLDAETKEPARIHYDSPPGSMTDVLVAARQALKDRRQEGRSYSYGEDSEP